MLVYLGDQGDNHNNTPGNVMLEKAAHDVKYDQVNCFVIPADELEDAKA